MSVFLPLLLPPPSPSLLDLWLVWYYREFERRAEC
jgi:hypothetical protein